MIALLGGSLSNDPVLSSLAVEKPGVGASEVGDQQLRVSAALGGVDLNRSNHNLTLHVLYRRLEASSQHPIPNVSHNPVIAVRVMMMTKVMFTNFIKRLVRIDD